MTCSISETNLIQSLNHATFLSSEVFSAQLQKSVKGRVNCETLNTSEFNKSLYFLLTSFTVSFMENNVAVLADFGRPGVKLISFYSLLKETVQRFVFYRDIHLGSIKEIAFFY